MKAALPILLALVITCCSRHPTKDPLSQISRQHNPANLKLTKGYDDYTERTFLSDRTELGVISLKDGNTSKYCFRSHHLCDDIGGTWFEMSDGQRIYMSGWFCCEVQLPHERPESLSALRSFIAQHNGVGP